MDLRIFFFFSGYLTFDGALARIFFQTNSEGSLDLSRLVPISSKVALWPNGTIPYVINPHFSNDSRQMIEKAMDHIHENSCVRFVERTNENIYTKIQPRSFCSATYGYGKRSIVELTRECTTKIGAIQHQLMHVMGFDHEHSRIDRDKYITVFKNYIEPDALEDYEQDAHDDFYTFGLPYDYQSVTHFTNDIGAKFPHLPTMVAKDNKKRKLGQNEKLSPIDVQKINAMYPCNGKSPIPRENNSTIENAHKKSIDDDNVNHHDETSI